jgi:ATP-dependent Clp protease ATP-binding subunit ClpC
MQEKSMPWSTRDAFSDASGFGLKHFTDRAIKVMAVGREQADLGHHEYIGAEHILYGLAHVEHGPGRVTLERLGVDIGQEHVVLDALLAALPVRKENEKLIVLTSKTQAFLTSAAFHAKVLNHNYVGTEHLVLALLTDKGSRASEFLASRGVTVERFREELLRFLKRS